MIMLPPSFKSLVCHSFNRRKSLKSALTVMNSRHLRRASSDRFMNALKLIPPSSTDGGDELSEDDVFFTGANLHNPPSTSTTPTPPPSVIHHRRHHKSYNPETFGILAALPESGDEFRSVLNSPPPPSSSRMIPTLPRPSVERQIFSLPERYHQSAPMNVPMRPLAKDTRRQKRFDDGNDGVAVDYDDDGEMLPPHEIVARQMSKTPVLSSSVLEGAGRTLKGRDLRQVRNAVFRQTGFID